MVFIGKKIIHYSLLIGLALLAISKINAVVLMFLSMLISVVAYAIPFGGAVAAGLVALLFIHEFGHIIAARVVGIHAAPPVFIPFVGALIRLNKVPVNAKMAAYIALGGPALGALSALVLIAGYFWTDSLLLLILAYTACLLNLFNLIPCEPFDGGKIALAISPQLWWVGSAIIAVIFIYTYNLVILCILLFSLWQSGRRQLIVDSLYYQLTKYQLGNILMWYIILLGVLASLSLEIGKLLI